MQEKTDVPIIGFRSVNKVIYPGTKAISIQEVKEKVRVLKIGKAADLDEVTNEMIKNTNDWVCNL